MIFRAGLRVRNSRASVGPSISGITTSETTRSTGRGGFLQDLDRLDAVAGFEHRVAPRRETAGIERPQTLLILDQEDCALAGKIGAGGAFDLIGRGKRALNRRHVNFGLALRNLLGAGHVPRQEDAEGRAFMHHRIDIHETARLLDDAVDG